ncbi:MAG TPA: hypothetical protein VMG59_07030 [Phycisphaerae bacterium]|nr:hypothetical protein [Phycisphaerae bacterium]
MMPISRLGKSSWLVIPTACMVLAAVLMTGRVSLTSAQQATPSPQPQSDVLSPSDISKIRLWEMTFPDSTPLQGTILDREQTLHQFWTSVILKNPDYQNMDLTQQDYESFISPNNLVNQVRLMLEFGDPSYWDKIQIDNDPQVMITFRSSIQPFILQSCATVGCHRDQTFKGFTLFADGGSPDRAETYTNFYILSTYTFNGMHLIDRNNPRHSLILQYMLPPDTAIYAHPGKTGPQQQVFNVEQMIQWIDSLRFPMHDYGITYQMPQEQPAAAGQ